MFFYWFIAFIGLNIQHVVSLKCKQKLFGFPENKDSNRRKVWLKNFATNLLKVICKNAKSVQSQSGLLILTLSYLSYLQKTYMMIKTSFIMSFFLKTFTHQKVLSYFTQGWNLCFFAPGMKCTSNPKSLALWWDFAPLLQLFVSCL